MKNIQALFQKIESANTLDFGTILSQSIELFKKTWLQGFLMLLFTILIMLPLIIIFYIPFIGLVMAQQESAFGDTSAVEAFFSSMSVVYVFSVILGAFVLGTVAIAVKASFYRVIWLLDGNKTVVMADFFFFVKKEHLGKLFLLVLASAGIAIPSVLLCYIPLIYTFVPLSLFVMIFSFNPDFSVGEILKVSFKLGHEKWLIIFGLIIVSSLLANVVGYLLCGVGLLFTSSFVYHPIYLVYKTVIGFNEQSIINEIGTLPKE